MPQKKKTAVFAALLLFALVLAALTAARVLFPKEPGQVRIYLRDALYQTVPIGKTAEIVLEQEDGKSNTVLIDETGVSMVCANCKNQLCVRTGKLSFADDGVLLSNWIICLPNNVSVEVVRK